MGSLCVPTRPENREKPDVQLNAAHSKIHLFSVDPGKELTRDTLAQPASALWRSWHLEGIVYVPCLPPGEESRAASPLPMGTGLHLNQMAYPVQIY